MSEKHTTRLDLLPAGIRIQGAHEFTPPAPIVKTDLRTGAQDAPPRG
jgi:hypothetical protein